MGKVVVTEFITLDGVIEDPGGSEGHDRGGWAFQFERGADGDQFKLDELMTADAQLLGRRTYEGFAAAWPERTDEMGFAEKMNSMPKYVVSTTMESADWNNTTVLPDAGEVARIKDDHEGEILVAGSATLVQALVDQGLVDELRLMIFPVVLGAGKKLFAAGVARKAFRVVDTKPAGETVIVTLHPAEEDAAE
jgi:dihydrofolate reductase